VGYGAEQKESRTQYDATRVHWQVYSPRKVELNPEPENAAQENPKE
jgi:hypothetical protein